MGGELEKIVNEEFELMGRSSTEGRLSIQELELSKTRILTGINFDKNGNQTSSARRSMKLVFRNGISRTILTSEEIKGEDNASIEVALVDGSNGNVVDFGRESSLNVEIVLVKEEFDAPEGEDWKVEEFEANIVPEMEGKMPLLAGSICLKLHRGIGILNNIKLRNHTIKMRPSKFRLGARVVDTFDRARVKEALTEFFTVKIYRNKYKKKHANPSPSDEVCRLVNIQKGGCIHKRLKSDKICTVQDFLTRLQINPEELKRIVGLRGKKWEDMVKNAKACTGESSNGHSNSSFQGTNSTIEDNVLDSLYTDEMEILCDGTLQLSPPRFDWQTFLLDFDKFSVSKRWRTCFHVSKWLFSNKKPASF